MFSQPELMYFVHVCALMRSAEILLHKHASAQAHTSHLGHWPVPAVEDPQAVFFGMLFLIQSSDRIA